jgi:hypothetical protein
VKGTNRTGSCAISCNSGPWPDAWAGRPAVLTLVKSGPLGGVERAGRDSCRRTHQRAEVGTGKRAELCDQRGDPDERVTQVRHVSRQRQGDRRGRLSQAPGGRGPQRSGAKRAGPNICTCRGGHRSLADVRLTLHVCLYAAMHPDPYADNSNPPAFWSAGTQRASGPVQISPLTRACASRSSYLSELAGHRCARWLPPGERSSASPKMYHKF